MGQFVFKNIFWKIFMANQNFRPVIKMGPKQGKTKLIVK